MRGSEKLAQGCMVIREMCEEMGRSKQIEPRKNTMQGGGKPGAGQLMANGPRCVCSLTVCLYESRLAGF